MARLRLRSGIDIRNSYRRDCSLKHGFSNVYPSVSECLIYIRAQHRILRSLAAVHTCGYEYKVEPFKFYGNMITYKAAIGIGYR